MTALQLNVPDEFVEAIARRVVELLRDDAPPAAPATDELLSVLEAAAYLRCSRQRVYDLVSARKLAVERDGRRVLIRRRVLDAYLAGGGQ